MLAACQIALLLASFLFYYIFFGYHSKLWHSTANGRFGIDCALPSIPIFTLLLALLTGLMLAQLASISRRMTPARCEQGRRSYLLALLDFLFAVILGVFVIAHDLGGPLDPIAYALLMVALVSAFVNFLKTKPAEPILFLWPLVSLLFLLLLLYLRLPLLEGEHHLTESIPERPTVILGRFLSIIGIGLYIQWGTFRRQHAFQLAGLALVLLSLAIYFGGMIEIVSGSVGRASHGSLQAAFYSSTVDIFRVVLLYMEAAMVLATAMLLTDFRLRR